MHDTVVQMARCSFDMHMQDIVGTLIAGASLIMLRPHGPLDLPYFISVLLQKHVTYMQSVPTYLAALCGYLTTDYDGGFSSNLRSLCCGGECLSLRFSRQLGRHGFVL